MLSVVGDLDLSTLGQFRSEVLRAIDETGPSLILDLSAVDFFETVSLGVVLEGMKRSAARDGFVVVVVRSERMVNEFRLTGVDRILTLVNSVAEAVDELRNESIRGA